jgi:hypothetical protein
MSLSRRISAALTASLLALGTLAITGQAQAAPTDSDVEPVSALAAPPVTDAAPVTTVAAPVTTAATTPNTIGPPTWPWNQVYFYNNWTWIAPLAGSWIAPPQGTCLTTYRTYIAGGAQFQTCRTGGYVPVGYIPIAPAA